MKNKEFVREWLRRARSNLDLTDYAVEARYPGEREPVSEGGYEEALKLAETVYELVSKTIKEVPEWNLKLYRI